LLNTGWVGGSYGIGKRISIQYTRAMLNAALEGKLESVEYSTDPIFGFQVPKSCPDVPDKVMDPASSWPSNEAYMKRYRDLASRFIDNFKKYEDESPLEVVSAGPKL
jgi:phosphoenolpyruvate carboxykinase (ATP)